MSTKNLLLKSCVCGVLATAALGVAVAQERATVLEEIVVTAQKRSESLQEVPIAISAYESKTRDLYGIDSINALTNLTPGLSYSTGLDRAFIRGIGRSTNNLATDAGVATYQDGFYSQSTTSAASSPLQVERIEVLRGPQGTLYGRNSIGGTINVISRQPTKDWYSEVRLAYENYQRHVIEGAVSGPISDSFRFRVYANSTRQAAGYFHNVAGGPDEGGVTDANYIELQLAADLGSSVEAWLKASVYGFDNRNRSTARIGSYDYGKIPLGFLAPAGAYGLTLPGSNFVQPGAPTLTTNPALTDIRSFSTNTPSQQHETAGPSYVGHLTWHLPGVDVKYIGGYTHYKYDSTSDFDGTAVENYKIPLSPTGPCATTNSVATPCSAVTLASSSIQRYIEDKAYWSNELNVSSSGDGSFQWLGGLYAYSENYEQPLFYPSTQSAFFTPYNIAFGAGPFGTTALAGLAAPNPSGIVYFADTKLRTDSLAAFAQTDWKIVDSLKMTVGARYSRDHKYGTEYSRQICYGTDSSGFALGCRDLALYGTNAAATDVTPYLISGTNPAVPLAPGVTSYAVGDPATGIWSRTLDAKWHATTGTAGFEWTPTTNALAYVKYSKGYKSGGLNTGALQAAPETNPEYVDAYEMGTKLTLAERFQVNASVFFYNYIGMQIPLAVSPPAGPTQTLLFNMDKVVSKGAELETIWQATDNLQVLFNYSYLDARIHSSCTPTSGTCFVDGVDPLALDPDANQAGPLKPANPALGAGASQSQDVNGQTVPGSPKNKLSLIVAYRFDFEPGSLTVAATDAWKDKNYSSIFNRSYNLAPSYSQVDLRATWTDKDNRISLVGYVRNALDKTGYVYQSGIKVGTPAGFAYTEELTPPRTYGLQLQYRVGASK